MRPGLWKKGILRPKIGRLKKKQAYLPERPLRNSVGYAYFVLEWSKIAGFFK